MVTTVLALSGFIISLCACVLCLYLHKQIVSLEQNLIKYDTNVEKMRLAMTSELHMIKKVLRSSLRPNIDDKETDNVKEDYVGDNYELDS
jgi:uncharacterized protein YoxC